MIAKINPSNNWKIKIKSVLCFRWDELTSHKAGSPRLCRWHRLGIRLTLEQEETLQAQGRPALEHGHGSEGWCARGVTTTGLPPSPRISCPSVRNKGRQKGHLVFSSNNLHKRKKNKLRIKWNAHHEK